MASANVLLGLKFLLTLLTKMVVLAFSSPAIILFWIFSACIWRPLVWAYFKTFRHDLVGFVTGAHLVFARGECFDHIMNITAVIVLNGPVQVETFQQHFEERVMGVKNTNGDALYEGFKRFCVHICGFVFWKTDTEFKILNHIRSYDYTGTMRIPMSPSEADVMNVMGALSNAPWPKNRSPWEILIISNYKGESKTVKLFRADHVLADGLSLYKAFGILAGNESNLLEPKMWKIKRSTWNTVMTQLKSPYDAMKMKALHSSDTLWPGLTGTKSSSGVACWSPAIPVATIKCIKRHFDVDYASVLYSAACGAIAKAFKNSGKSVPETFVAAVVIPRGNHPGGLSIHANGIYAKLPLSCASGIIRLQSVHQTFRNMRTSSASEWGHSLIQGMSYIPIGFISRWERLRSMNWVNVGVSNMPVAATAEFFDASELLDLIVVGSLSVPRGIQISFSGTNNRQRASFMVNKTLFESDDIARNLGIWFAEEIQVLMNNVA